MTPAKHSEKIGLLKDSVIEEKAMNIKDALVKKGMKSLINSAISSFCDDHPETLDKNWNDSITKRIYGQIKCFVENIEIENKIEGIDHILFEPSTL